MMKLTTCLLPMIILHQFKDPTKILHSTADIIKALLWLSFWHLQLFSFPRNHCLPTIYSLYAVRSMASQTLFPFTTMPSSFKKIDLVQIPEVDNRKNTKKSTVLYVHSNLKENGCFCFCCCPC